MVDYDEAGSIGKRYRRQDAIGTPLCITFDFDSEADQSVTIRDRDTMEQVRVKISDLKDFQNEFLKQAKNDFLKVFVVNGRPEGYFRIYSQDKKNFFADIITSKPYEHCYSEIVAYMKNILKLAPEFNSLTILLKRYRDTAGALEEVLKNNGFSTTQTTQILVKDYWKKIDDAQCDAKLFVLFNDLSVQPARYNSFTL